jgi:hypothetical protein
MRFLIVAVALATGCVGCGRSQAKIAADPDAVHEPMKKLNEEVLRQEGRAPNKRR